MTLLALAIQAISFYMVYNTSKRAVLRTDAVSVWFQQHNVFSIVGGLFLLVMSFVLFVIAQGFGVGMFLGFLSLMTIAGFIVVLSPLKTKRSN